MPKLRFLGGVHPKEPLIRDMPEFGGAFTVPSINLRSEFVLKIKNSEIAVECGVDSYDPGHLVMLFHQSFDLARVAVDLFAFATGHSFTVVLDAFEDPTGRRQPINVGNPHLAGLCTAFRINTANDDSFVETYALMLKEPRLFLILNDLVSAINIPHIALVSCARALEGIRRAVATAGASRSTQWKELRDALNIEQAYQMFITNHSIEPRHGGHDYIPDTVGQEVIRRTWAIMDRFIEFRKRGNQPLTEPGYPRLV